MTGAPVPRGVDPADIEAALGDARRVAEAMLGAGPDADDAVQQTAESLLASRARLTRRTLRRYAEVTARNAAVDLARRRHREPPAGMLRPRADADLPETAALRSEEHRAVRAAVGRLSPSDRDLLTASVLEAQPLKDSAAASGRSSRAQSLRLIRAKAHLRLLTALQFRRHHGLPERCRQILTAVSERDRRRLADLDAEAHIRGCPDCRDLAPLLESRNRGELALAGGAAGVAAGLRHWTGSHAVPITAGVAAAGALAAGLALGLGGGGHPAAPSRPARQIAPVTVRFATGSAALTAGDTARHRRFAVGLPAHPGAITVVGYADPHGARSTNLRLSQRRARAVAQRLRALVPGRHTAARAGGEGAARVATITVRPSR